jgi:IclR family transcriptional regulator, acetate operon repressor
MAGQAGSQAVERAAALLAVVVESNRPRTFTSLVDQLGLAKSTTSRLLQALERNRLVQRDRSGCFRPGALFDQYAARRDPVRDLGELAQPALERLGELTGETINLAVPRGSSIVQVSQVDSRYMLGATNWLGTDVPPHCSAAGKVFYACGVLPLPSGELTSHAPGTLTRAQLERDLADISRLGWAVAWEELEPGLVAVAAPVRAVDGSVVAAVSVSGPVTRITRSRTAKLGALLVAETRSLSAELGLHPDIAHPGGTPPPGREGVA